jgi:hypothetical protein
MEQAAPQTRAGVQTRLPVEAVKEKGQHSSASDGGGSDGDGGRIM